MSGAPDPSEVGKAVAGEATEEASKKSATSTLEGVDFPVPDVSIGPGDVIKAFLNGEPDKELSDIQEDKGISKSKARLYRGGLKIANGLDFDIDSFSGTAIEDIARGLYEINNSQGDSNGG